MTLDVYKPFDGFGSFSSDIQEILNDSKKEIEKRQRVSEALDFIDLELFNYATENDIKIHDMDLFRVIQSYTDEIRDAMDL